MKHSGNSRPKKENYRSDMNPIGILSIKFQNAKNYLKRFKRVMGLTSKTLEIFRTHFQIN